MFGHGAVVHPDYGQSGILFLMDQAVTELACDHNVGAIIVTASSFYATKAMIKIGYRMIRSIDYATFELPDGTRPFHKLDMGEHRSTFLMGRKLKSTKNQNNNDETKTKNQLIRNKL